MGDCNGIAANGRGKHDGRANGFEKATAETKNEEKERPGRSAGDDKHHNHEKKKKKKKAKLPEISEKVSGIYNHLIISLNFDDIFRFTVNE